MFPNKVVEENKIIFFFNQKYFYLVYDCLWRRYEDISPDFSEWAFYRATNYKCHLLGHYFFFNLQSLIAQIISNAEQ